MGFMSMKRKKGLKNKISKQKENILHDPRF